MWKIRFLVVGMVLVGTLVFGTLIAQGGWFWNAHIDVEGVETHVVWTVEDDPTGADDYKAKIKMVLPREANAELVAQADNERVRISHSDRLDCLHTGIQSLVNVKVKPNRGADGEDVRVTVYEGPPGPSGTVLGEATGEVNETIRMSVLIPTASLAC